MTSDEIAEYATSGNWEDRRKLAAHPHVPEEIWRQLATDTTADVRLALANNKNIPTDLLNEIAAKDRNAVVANAADKTLLGRPGGWEPSQPEEKTATEESKAPRRAASRGLLEEAMTDKLENLERLGRLLDEGKLSEDEYEALKQDVLTSSLSVSQADESVDPDSSTPEVFTRPTPGGTPTLYKVALGMGIASVFLGGTFGLLAWATVAVSGWALYDLKTENNRWMAWAGLAAGIVYSLMNAYLNGYLDGIL